jgi:uncharacterized repeat protein (TIGR01451 family)
LALSSVVNDFDGRGRPQGPGHDIGALEGAAQVSGAADLVIVMDESQKFRRGQTATYTLQVSNSGEGATSGQVTVIDNLPAGLSATSFSGPGWNCALSALACTRNDALAPGASYPSITLTVLVSDDAPSWITNVATVSGGGEANTANSAASSLTRVPGR